MTSKAKNLKRIKGRPRKGIESPGKIFNRKGREGTAKDAKSLEGLLIW